MKQEKISKKQLLGALLVEQGLMSEKQLKEALKRQDQVGGQIGSILIEMGFIGIDDLCTFLGKQLGVPSANLFKVDIGREVLKQVSWDKIKAMKILPVSMDENSLTLAMVDPGDMAVARDVEFTLGKKVRPVVVPAFQMDAARQHLFQHPKETLQGEVIAAEVDKGRKRMAPDLISLLQYLAESGANVMLLTAGVPPSIKMHNEVERLSMDSLIPIDCEKYARDLMSDRDWEVFARTNDLDLGITYPDIGRFRVNAYRQRNSISLALRYFPEKMPSLKELNLPDWVRGFALRPQGLILITGPAGHGKTTTLSAMVDIINSHRKCNIITLEDPIEYLHKHKRSNVNQRQIGKDSDTFSEGLRHVFRQAPDVIVVGELRDKESFEIALRAADTGHLVLSTVHADNSTSIIERVINMFPPHQEHLIRMKIADCLLLSFSQRLVPLKKGKGRVLAYEKLINNYAIKSLIRERKTHQIRSQMQAGTEEFTSIDASLAGLFNAGLITLEDGLRFSENGQFYRELTAVAGTDR
ncbi:MAG: PilT/PilU family type 4a pilus ATPase [Deltaproteobacteria bacterium]|nr:PilT/PilU family type 4a pilus ATPase [Deltaproteobacteria bacterium]